MENNILPVIDNQLLQQKANEYAQKGAEECIKEFYTGYKSPYKEAIEANLKNKGLHHSFEIPDIIGVLNDKFSKEVDQIANTAIAKTFIPMVKEFLTREEGEIKFSKILEKFIEKTDFKNNNDLSSYDYEIEKIEDTDKLYSSSFFQYQISNGEIGYELRFYKSNKGTTIMSLPNRKDESNKYYRGYESNEKMKVSLDGGVTLELPFVKGILEDEFVSFIARLVIGNNNIIFDVEDFNEDMFLKNDDCHC